MEETKCKTCGDNPKLTCTICGRKYTQDVYGKDLSPSDKTWENLKQVIRDSGAERIDRDSIFNHVKPFIEDLLTSATIKAKEESLRELIDHYWDSLEKDRDMIELHIKGFAKHHLGINLEEPKS